MATETIDSGKLTSFLSKTRTVGEVAEKFAVTRATATRYLQGAVTSGTVAVKSATTGKRGRPARLYTLLAPPNTNPVMGPVMSANG